MGGDGIVRAWPDLVGRACDSVSEVRDGLDYRGVTELPTEASDSDRDGASEGVGVFVPHLLEEVLGAEDRVLCPHERLEDGELLDRQVEPSPVAGNGGVQGG